MVAVEIAMRPMRSPSSVAIGASRIGGRSASTPGSATRKVLTQRISGNRRKIWRNDRPMPMTRTAMMTLFSPGLERKAVRTCCVEDEGDEGGDDQEDRHPPEIDLRAGELVRVILAPAAPENEHVLSLSVPAS